MKNLLCLFLMIMLLFSCKKDKETHNLPDCGVSDPLTELDWLANMAQPCEENEQIGFEIHQAVYCNKQTVFFSSIVCAACDIIFHVTLLDCDGEVIKTYQTEDQNVFEEEVGSVKTIYNCYSR